MHCSEVDETATGSANFFGPGCGPHDCFFPGRVEDSEMAAVTEDLEGSR